MGASIDRGGCEQAAASNRTCREEPSTRANQRVWRIRPWPTALLGAALVNHSQLSKHAGIWFRNQGRRARSA